MAPRGPAAELRRGLPHKTLQTSTIPVDNFVGNLVIKRAMARLQGTKIGLLKFSAGKSF
jgi:hypothetical protein